MQRGTNLGRLGGYNQAVVLESIRRASDGVSRVELAASTGLSPQTISNVVRRLLDGQWVREAGTVISGPGKPRTLVELVPDRLVSVGIHLDPSVLTYVIVDLRGNILQRHRAPLPGTASPQETLDAMVAEVNALIAASGYQRENVVGVGIAAPGPVDVDGGRLVRPPLLTGWDEVALVEPLREALGLEVILAKDTVAAATAEVWVGAGQTLADFVSVYVGTGVGAGLVLGGSVLAGQTGNAGELGHVLSGSVVPEVCAVCGRHDCLAVNLNFDTIVRRGREAGIDVPDVTGRPLSEHIAAATQVMTAAAHGNVAASEVARELAAHVSLAVGHIASLLDVDQVVICGPLWEVLRGFAEDTVTEHVNQNFRGTLPRDVAVTSSELGGWIAAIGGACVVLEDLLAPKTSGLLLR